MPENAFGIIAVGILYPVSLTAAFQLLRQNSEVSSERYFWLSVCFVLLGAGLVEAFGLTAQTTQMFRNLSAAQGWYGNRRGIQLEVIVGLCAIAITVFLMPGTFIPADRPSRRVFLNLALLLGLLALRTFSMHEIDAILNIAFAGQVTVHHLVEGFFLGFVFLNLRRAHRMRAAAVRL